MKLLSPNWPSSHAGSAVGFFAQAALELVHEKSWEGYKLPSLSPRWRLIELSRVCESVMRGVLPPKALEPMISEVNQSFSSDPVIRQIFKQRHILSSDLEISLNEKPQDIYSQVGFMIATCGEEYRSVAEQLIKDECFGGGRRSEISLLLKNYLSELRLKGHSRTSIEKSVRYHFFDTSPKVNKSLLNRFFQAFPNEKRKYEVYGVANTDLIKVLGTLIPVNEVQPKKVPRAIVQGNQKLIGDSYFVVENEAHDPYTAGIYIGKLLNAGQAVHTLFPGPRLGEIPESFFVRRVGKSDLVKVPSSRGFSRRILSRSTNSAMRHMERFRDLITRSKNLT